MSAPTEELDPFEPPPRESRSPVDPPTAELPVVPSAVRAAPLGSTRAQCAACGAPVASDQRYCVECGQRLGGARLPFMDDASRHSGRSTVHAAPTKARLSVNSTLIAGVGTLLLAMGVGILIGRSSPGSSKASPVQYVTAPGPGVLGATGAGTEAASSTAESGSIGGSSRSSKKAKSAAKASKPKLPPPKVVTVGSAGKGAGYEKGHFTGNFFGKGEE
ncbi:MAG: hypothetical protein ACTHM1_12995 [Solirubrobacteraceae bacterium]